jgi:hypothetical protein
VTTGPVGPEAAARARLRMSDADRERAIEALKIAFVQGRLTKDELDTRAGLALVSRTYAELTAATANISARPAAPRPRPMPRPITMPRPIPNWPPPELPASRTARRPANHWGVKWALALATIALPTMIAGALITGDRNLFSSTTVALMAYILALLVAAANGLAARIEDDNSGKPGDQRRR